ncbi:hypothetical protein ABENE_21450 [Asticcacaulis benevestitus DSM 16100 = ATCC BAA-896]|uniref:Uncharacterized protein n=1 Tax=Asticcacaulis benevestitus DSM 16100 = ATCC BAA-896 TaxID=1121022 RepID=V4NIX9_9CAUL|nr:hypothetical protein ABENE_21450 [Asticcacaulis benevestitus DSM 16100 = ATCC BAA-896]
MFAGKHRPEYQGHAYAIDQKGIARITPSPARTTIPTNREANQPAKNKPRQMTGFIVVWSAVSDDGAPSRFQDQMLA